MYFITLLFKNLRRRVGRTVLTCAGVSVAVGAMVALLGISSGFESSLMDALRQRDIDIVVVAEGMIDQLTSDLEEAAQPQIENVPGVARVEPALMSLLEYTRDDPEGAGEVLNILIQGWRPTNFQLVDLVMLGGRKIAPGDRHVIMLGETLAHNIGKKVGDVFLMHDERFEVIGVFRSLTLFENGGAVAPLGPLQELLRREGSVTGYSVKLADPHDPALVERACSAINDLKDERGRRRRLLARASKEYAQNSLHIRLTQGMAWLTSAVAVLVGVFGMTNTMIMSVVERVREISTLRAIGWRRSRVLRMVLGEALLLSLGGAALGCAGAAALTWLLTKLPSASGFVASAISPWVMLQGLAMSLLVGLLGGAFPAWWASRLSPSEGLRHE